MFYEKIFLNCISYKIKEFFFEYKLLFYLERKYYLLFFGKDLVNN